MSSTPLFDSVARRHDPEPVPTSPLTGPVAPPRAAAVPDALVSAINSIKSRGVAGPERALTAEQMALVESVADAMIRAVVDAIAVEVEHILTTGIDRS